MNWQLTTILILIQKSKSLKLPKIKKTEKGGDRCFIPVLTWCPVMLWISLASLQTLSRGPWRLASGRRIRLTLCGECVPVVGVSATWGWIFGAGLPQLEPWTIWQSFCFSYVSDNVLTLLTTRAINWKKILLSRLDYGSGYAIYNE